MNQPVYVPDGSCACSRDGRTCMCAPHGLREQLAALADARFEQLEAEERADVAATARWRADRERLGAEVRAAMDMPEHDEQTEQDDERDDQPSPRDVYVERQRNAWRPR